ncbi:T9SS type B sorting domain-containing protein [Saccharicrinis aurantiacus]|uniref:T9SS type B sorting domain-containing protein n=1 Tax=Saccharicrinis aurantiacus TaxID=1849719 RepID=UPI000838E2B8|nr:gliding motility-associated C-terminal domain-containing protein [Saccharicrinis aurantiacus]
MKNNFQFLRIALFSAFIIIGFSNTIAQSSEEWSEKKIEKYYSKREKSLSSSSLKSTSSSVELNGVDGTIPSISEKYCSDEGIIEIVPDDWTGANEVVWTIKTFVGDVEDKTDEWSEIVGEGKDAILRFDLSAIKDTKYFGAKIYFEFQLYDSGLWKRGGVDYTIVYQTPTIYDLTSDITICSGESADLLLSGSEIGMNYQLKDGDNNNIDVERNGSGSAFTFTVSPITTTDYYVEVTNGSDVSCSSIMNNTVTVTVNTPIQATASNDGPTCEGDPLILTATPIGTEYTYAWTGPNGFTSTEQAPVINPTSAASGGDYTVEVTNTNTTCQSSATTTAVVRSIPVPTITGDQTVCLNSSVTYTTESGMSNYVWTYPAEFVPTSATNTNTITGTWITLGVGKLQVVYENLDACTSPVLGELDITTTEATAGLTSDKGTSICVNTLVVFTATGGVSYEFMVNGMTVQGPSAQSTFSINTLNDGDVVTVKVIDTNGCEDTHSGITMTVLPEPTINLIADDLTPCENTPITLTASGATTYTFYKNGSIAQGSSTQATYTTVASLNSGDEFYVVGNDGSCDGTSNTLTINVNPLPVISLVSDKGNVFCANENVTFTASNAITYEFFVDDVSQGAASTTATFTSSLLTDGQVVKVIGTDGNGCEGETSITVTVNETTAGLSSDLGTTICENTLVVFTATGGVSYEFMVNGMTVQGPSAQSTFSINTLNNGDVVTVKVIDANSCEDTHAGITMTVLPEPTISLIANNLTPCENTPITLTASGATTYTFYKNGSIVQGSSTQATYTTVASLNSGDEFYVVGSEGSCDETSNTLTINVNPLPVIGLVSDKGNVFCANENVTFTASNAITYEFFVDDVSQGAASTTATFTSSLLTDGQVVKVIGTDVNGCEGENSITVTVNQITAVLNITNPSPPGTSVCSGTEVTFNASATGGSGNNSYEFFVDGTSQGVSSNPIFKYTIISDTKISVKVVDLTNGCEDTEEADMVALALPSVSIVNPADGDSFCANTPVTIMSSPAGYNSYTFYYDDGNGPTVLYTSASEEYTKADGFTQGGQLAVVADNGSCSSQSTIIDFTINQLPLVTLTSDQTNDEFCSGRSVTFTAEGAVNYEFFVDDVSQGASSTTATFTSSLLTDGQVVKVIGTDGNGCEDETSTTVTVNETTAGLSSDLGTTICENTLVVFTATGGVSYEFMVNGMTVQGPSAQSTFSTNTLNNGDVVTVKVIDGNGCEDTHAGIVMSVSPVPVVILSPDPAEICQGESINFAASGATQYEFFVNELSVQGPSNQDTFVLSGASDGDDVYVVGSDGTCVGTSNSVSVIVNPLPTASLSSSPSGAIVSGTEVVFTAGGGDVYEFFVNGSSVQAGANNIYIISTLIDGDIVSVEVTDLEGCSNSEQLTISVLEGIELKDIIATSENYCEGESGISIYVDDPQVGITYELVESVDNSVIVGAPLEYTGKEAIEWQDIKEGRYTVLAYYASLPDTYVEMKNVPVVVTEITLPKTFEMDPIGVINTCSSGGTNISIPDSENGVTYTLMLNGFSTGRSFQGEDDKPIIFYANTSLGVYTILAETDKGSCPQVMDGQLEIKADDTHRIFDLEVKDPADSSNPLDGRFCVGNSGVELILTNSASSDTTYVLKREGDTDPVKIISGGDGEISFNIIDVPGVYAVFSQPDNGCELQMNNVIEVIEVAQPIQYKLVTDNVLDNSSGEFCKSSAGVTLSLDNSEVDISYDLLRDGVDVVDNQVGTGSVIEFDGPIDVEGDYSVRASVQNLGCSLTMLDTIDVFISPDPIDVTVKLDQGFFCFGDSARLVVQTPETNVVYSLVETNTGNVYTDWLPISSSVDSIEFYIKDAGDYEVYAKNNLTDCDSVLISGGPYNISEIGLPAKPTISSAAVPTGCGGEIITVTASELDVVYQLAYETSSNNFVDMLGKTVIGDGSDIDIDTVYNSGRYYVYGTNVNGCLSANSDTLTITTTSTITQYDLLESDNNGSVCKPTDILKLSLSDSEAGITYTLWFIDGVGTSTSFVQDTVSIGGSLEFSEISYDTYGHGQYYVTGSNGTCTVDMNNRITSNLIVPNLGLSVDPDTIICENDAVLFTASGTELYQFFQNGVSNGVPSSTSTFKPSSVSDRDQFYVIGDTVGCLFYSDTITMTVNPVPIIDLLVDNSIICEGTEVHFEATGASQVTYYLNNVVVSTSTLYKSSTLEDGDSIYVIGSNGNCETHSDTIVMTVFDKPEVTLSVSPNDTIIAGEKLTFTAGGADEYEFFVNGDSEQGPNVSNIFVRSLIGDSTVTVAGYINSSGCINDSSIAITVLDAITSINVYPEEGNYCIGEDGVDIYLQPADSQFDVTYELRNSLGNSISALKYDGINPIIWNNIKGDDTYSVYAYYDIFSSAEIKMQNDVVVTERPLPDVYNMFPTGDTTGCANYIEFGVDSSQLGINYELLVNGTSQAQELGINDTIKFGTFNLLGTYIVEAIDTTFGCRSVMNGNYIMNTDSSEVAYDLYFENGIDSTYAVLCTDDSVQISLSGSDSVVKYVLFNNSSSTGDTIVGDGNQLTFGYYNALGNYYVEAITNDDCRLLMNNQLLLEAGSEVNSYQLISNNDDPTSGKFCDGGSAVMLGINGQQANVVYQLLHNGTAIKDTIGLNSIQILWFGEYSDLGEYSVVASYGGEACTRDMDNTIEVEMLEQPSDIFYETTGFLCGSDAYAMVLNGAEDDVFYELISLGNSDIIYEERDSQSQVYFTISEAGEYLVRGAKNRGMNQLCSYREFSDTVSVIQSDKPYFEITSLGNSSDCNEVTIGVNSSDSDITYQLVYFDGSKYVDVVGPNGDPSYYTEQGNDGLLEFNSISDNNRDYWARGVNNITLCSELSINSVNVSGGIEKFELKGDTPLCKGEPGEFYLESSQPGVTYLLFNSSNDTLATEQGTGEKIDFDYLAFQADNYYVEGFKVISATDTCSAPVSDVLKLEVADLPIAFPMSGSGITCDLENKGALITLDSTEVDTDYYLFRDKVNYVGTLNSSAAPNAIDTLIHQVGLYTIVAKNEISNCTSNMNGSVNVEQYSQVLLDTVLYDKNGYCENDEDLGLPISLTNGRDSIYYQVIDINDPTIVYLPTEGSTDLGGYPAGTYNVFAYREGGACEVQLSHVTDAGDHEYDIIVVENPRPELNYELFIEGTEGSKQGFINSKIGMDNSQSSVTYQLSFEMNDVVGEMNGVTGESIVFDKPVDTSGKYYVFAETDKGCSGWINDFVSIYDSPLITYDDQLNFKKGYNQDTVNVAINDIFVLPLDSCIRDTAIGVHPDSLNINFFLLDIDENGDTTEVESIKRNRVGDYKINSTTGEIILVKTPEFFGRDTVKYVAKNINKNYSYRLDTASVYIYIGNKYFDDKQSFLLPNAFSPNGDGINDLFKITGLDLYYGSGAIKSTLEVFNRWGSMVYRSKEDYYGDGDNWWDGKSTESNMVSLGQDCPNGTYFYIFTVSVNLGDGDIIEDKFNGYIELRR